MEKREMDKQKKGELASLNVGGQVHQVYNVHYNVSNTEHSLKLGARYWVDQTCKYSYSNL